MTEEDKPVPSGRPRPGIMPEPKEDSGKFQRKTLVETALTDIRFWIFVCGMLVGILIGLAF